MKKAAFIFILLSGISLVSAASNDLMTIPGDPKKEGEKQPTFTLAKGYFSWFGIFSIPVTQQDTFKLATPSIIPKEQQLKK